MKIIVNKESGITIVEVITAVVLSGIFIISMASALTSMNSLNTRAEKLSTVNAIAEGKIEELRSESFLSLPDDGTTVDFTTEIPNSIPEPIAEYMVTDLTVSTKQVDLTIEYGDFKSTRVVSFSTVIGELGVGQY